MRLVLWGMCLCLCSIVASPNLDISISNTTITLGEPIAIRIKTSQKIKKAHVGFGQKKFDLFLEKEEKKKFTYVTYIAASRKLDNGELPLDVHALLDSGERFYKRYNVILNYPPIKPGGEVTLSPQKNKLSTNTSLLSTEVSLITSFFNQKTETSLMHSSFIRPVKGRISSGFGAERLYNGRYVRSHAGIDFANKKGTLIVAPNDGVVLLSKTLDVHGNTLMIDHGFGIVTIYNHLESRSVNAGDSVKRGQPVGKLGNTGVATGPHLHWGMSTQGVRVDPLLFMTIFNGF